MNKQRLIFSAVFSLILSVTSAFAEVTEQLPMSAQGAVPGEKQVFPSGRSIGVTLSTNGAMIVSVAEMESKNGLTAAPARDAGLKSGDMITSFNGTAISGVDDLNLAISRSGGKSSPITVKRDGKTIETLVIPQLSAADGKFRIGIWVKDAASGIGTVTFYDPENQSFAALGHGICISDTENVLPADEGSILGATIVSVKRGERGSPGELKGVFSEDKTILGKIKKNSVCGIFGTAEKNVFESENPICIAAKSEVHTGSAYILANVEGGAVEKFDIEIQRLMPQSAPSPKGMVIKITDRRLIEKTGGIVQGMSGCPIIQDNKLAGAVTHVFINDPTRGYGIFAEWLIDGAAK